MKTTENSKLTQASPSQFFMEAEIKETWRHLCSSVSGTRSTQIIKMEMEAAFQGEDISLNNDETGRRDIFRQKGITNEDISRVFYDLIKPVPSHQLDIMTNLRLDRSCGLQNIEGTESKEKQFWFVYLIFSVLFNISSLLIMNWSIFETYTSGMQKSLEHMRVDHTLFATMASLAHDVKETMASLEKNVTRAQAEVSRSAIEKSYLNATIVNSIHDFHTQEMFLNIAAIVGCGEVLGLVCLTLMSLLHVTTFLCDPSEYKAYMAIYKLMQRRLPEFSTFSSLRLIHKVHPTLLYLELQNHMTQSSYKRVAGMWFMTGVWFILYRFMLGTMGLLALAVKILVVGLTLLNPRASVTFKGCGLVSLMVQCMGCIHMEHVLQDRIMLLVFGGQDACYSDDELAYRNVFQARLAKEIWNIYRYGKKCEGRRGYDPGLPAIEEEQLLESQEVRRGRTEGNEPSKHDLGGLMGVYRALVMLTTFDHYDLQWIFVQGSLDVRPAMSKEEEYDSL